MHWNASNLHWGITFFECYSRLGDGYMLTAFLNLIYSTKIRRDAEDQICWTPTKSRLFEVKSFCGVLYGGGAQSFPWKSIWKVKVTIKLAFFTRQLLWGKFSTLDNLHRRNIIVVEWCCMCNKAGDTVDHVLLHCDFAS